MSLNRAERRVKSEDYTQGLKGGGSIFQGMKRQVGFQGE